MRLRWLVVGLVLIALAPTAGLAIASPPRPADLRVAGGTDAWHASRSFSLSWTTSPPGGPPPAATLYRISDLRGATIGGGRFAWARDGIGPLIVPSIPGTYSVEVWFENATGEQGPAATAQLRFDNVRPSAIEPQSVPTWIGRSAFPLRVRLSHPAGPSPISGIRGYAVAINTEPSGAPCTAADRCSDAETTLRGGVENDEVTIAALPEGTCYLHAVAVSGSGMKSAKSGRAMLRVDITDPITQLAGVPAGWTNRTVPVTASATDAGSGMSLGGDGAPPFTAIRIDGRAPAIARGRSITAHVIDEGVHQVTYYARDAAGNIDDGGENNGIVNHVPRTATVRIDRTRPRVAFTNSQDPRDPDLLQVSVADTLSGPDPSRGWVGLRPAGSSDSFERLPTMALASDELHARWDSDAYPAGDYEFKATGYDKAGNATVTTRRRNGGPMILSNPLKATTTLSAGFSRHLLKQTVPYGRGIRVAGRLTTGIRSPLDGMPVRIVERFAAGPGPAVRISTVKTGPGGTYSLQLAPGPSRDVTATFAGSPTLGRTASAPLQLGVRSAVRLRTSSGVAEVGGAPLVFGGRVVPPAAIPAEGKSVQLQFRLPGQTWSEFRTILTDRGGRFHYAYRFSDDDSRGASFQFRAYVPAQDDWPYEPGGSRPVLVRGY